MKTPLLPYDVKQFNKARVEFERWLLAHGAEIRTVSNPFEVSRFTTPDGVGVIYRNKADQISAWENGAEAAYIAYKTGDNLWRLEPKKIRSRGDTYGHRGSTIIERDGPTCFYCDEPFRSNGIDRRTLEHLVPIIHGGPDHLSNMVLAHQRCNVKAGNLSVAEKVRLREKMRAKDAR